MVVVKWVYTVFFEAIGKVWSSIWSLQTTWKTLVPVPALCTSSFDWKYKLALVVGGARGPLFARGPIIYKKSVKSAKNRPCWHQVSLNDFECTYFLWPSACYRSGNFYFNADSVRIVDFIYGNKLQIRRLTNICIFGVPELRSQFAALWPEVHQQRRRRLVVDNLQSKHGWQLAVFYKFEVSPLNYLIKQQKTNKSKF